MASPGPIPHASTWSRLNRPHDVALAVVLIALLSIPCLASASPLALERSGAEGSDSLVVLDATDSLAIAPEDSLEVDAPVFRRRASLPT